MVETKHFGITKEGKEVFEYILSTEDGFKVSLLSYGATIKDIVVPGKDGGSVDVCMGFDSLPPYEAKNPHFGAPIGRVGNRIAGGKFTLNGTEYTLAQNNNTNNLHSGPDYFEKRIWEAKVQEDAVEFSLKSPHMDQGYPGEMDIRLTYSLYNGWGISLHYEATTTEDTLCNMTNHCYFNLNGHGAGSVRDHGFIINADRYTPVDDLLIPTGEEAPVADTVFDFRNEKPMGENEYDHNFCLKGEGLREVATARGDKSGIVMKTFTDLPGMQFYTGNFIGEKGLISGKAGASYDSHGAFCFETQYYPDAVNQKAFKTPLLKAGDKYDSTTIYVFER